MYFCRSLLTCLTSGDHVIIFAPPPAFDYQWRKVTTIMCYCSHDNVCFQIKVVSDALHDYWKSHYYDNRQPSSDTSQLSNDDNFYELDRRRKLLSITSFLWLPGVVRNHKHSTVVMVITTETNHIVFIRCVFDLLQG